MRRPRKPAAAGASSSPTPRITPIIHARASALLGALVGLRGDFDEGWRLIDRSRSALEELGARTWFTTVAFASASIALVSGRLEAAELDLRRGLRMLEGTGERGRTATLAALLALVLLGQGNLIEAESFALLARDTTLPEDFDAESYWRAANGRVLAEKGDLEGALRLHRDALEFNGRTDEIGIRADFLCSLAEVAK